MVARLFCSRSYPALAPGAAPCDSARSHSLPSIARASHARGWPRAKQDRDRGECPRPPELVDRDRGESHDSSPPTPPYIRVRIRRFDRLSTVGVSRRAGESDSGVRRNGFGPFERRIRASPFLIAAKASDLDIRPHGRFEVSTSKRPSIVQAFSETRSAYYAFC